MAELINQIKAQVAAISSDIDKVEQQGGPCKGAQGYPPARETRQGVPQGKHRLSQMPLFGTWEAGPQARAGLCRFFR